MPTEIEDRMKAIASLIERLAHYETEAALCKAQGQWLVQERNMAMAVAVRKGLREFGIPVLRGTIEG